MEMLTNCPWKGNIRELANFIERAVILTRGEELEVPITELAPLRRPVLPLDDPYLSTSGIHCDHRGFESRVGTNSR